MTTKSKTKKPADMPFVYSGPITTVDINGEDKTFVTGKTYHLGKDDFSPAVTNLVNRQLLTAETEEGK